MQNEIEYPIRINRYLYLKNYCSRRKADEMIEKGQVKVNGKLAVLGQKVNKDDKVEVGSEMKKMKQNYEYFAFNKPTGVVSHNPQEGEKSVDDFFPTNKKLAPVGRLDKKSEGLMFLTNDGRIIDKMLNPKYEHEKEYSVRVDKEIKSNFIRKMSNGVDIEGYRTKPAQITQSGPKSFRIILTEGKKHQIRRMCIALGYQVQNLKRLRIMNIQLAGLQTGESRPLFQDEKMELLKNINVI
ncbi:rRNA pseudouridine synthase [Candidatus Parcubacteria bacterium]|nr:rRNA pseudouridine synthase [Candidatus Parcubacteria bacterium]